jgi:hypothetical protein
MLHARYDLFVRSIYEVTFEALWPQQIIDHEV